jgi:hypothetical protein
LWYAILIFVWWHLHKFERSLKQQTFHQTHSTSTSAVGYLLSGYNGFLFHLSFKVRWSTLAWQQPCYKPWNINSFVVLLLWQMSHIRWNSSHLL